MMMVCPRCWGSGQERSRACDPCDGTGKVPDVQLSRHFSLSELLRSERAVAFSIANDPTPLEVRRLKDLAVLLLEPLRAHFGPLLITSGLRKPKLNEAVKGSPTSAHVIGWAADVVPAKPVDYFEVLRWLGKSGLAWDQAIHEGSWIHLGLRRPVSGEQRRELRVRQGGKHVLWQAA